jgi:hypothetical protein
VEEFVTGTFFAVHVLFPCFFTVVFFGNIFCRIIETFFTRKGRGGVIDDSSRNILGVKDKTLGCRFFSTVARFSVSHVVFGFS